MKRVVTLILILGCIMPSLVSYSQKKIINNETYKSWETLKEIKNNVSSIISNDGRHFIYKYGSPSGGDFVVISSIDSAYSRRFPVKEDYGNSCISFTEDSKFAIILSRGDSLVILHLNNYKTEFVNNVHSFKLGCNRSSSWLAYINNNSASLVLRELNSDLKKTYSSVKEFLFNRQFSVLLVKTNESVDYIDLTKNTTLKWSDYKNASGITFDESGERLVFLNKNNASVEISYYHKGMNSPEIIVSDKNLSISDMVLSDFPDFQFTPDGKKIFFRIKDKRQRDILIESNVTIWSYKDSHVGQPEYNNSIVAVYDIEGGRMVQIQEPGTSVIFAHNCSTHVLLYTNVQNKSEYYWNDEVVSLYIVSLNDGIKRKIIQFEKNISIPLFEFSPSGKFVIWMDATSGCYYTYNVSNGETFNISKQVNAVLYNNKNDIPERNGAFGIAGWLPDDKSVLVYDRFDIWQLDPIAKLAPVNITRRTGRKGNIIIRKIVDDVTNNIFSSSSLLTGFNPSTKANGIWKSADCAHLDKMALGDFIYYGNNSVNAIGALVVRDLPQKAKNKELYIVKRMSAHSSPNLFCTSDFINYKKLTDIHPESTFNWMRSELIKWSSRNEKAEFGILYKPENFNQKLKYPVIFHCYEKLSDELNYFRSPNLSIGELNIPWYVSNGYIVFVPDVKFETGNNVVSITNSILGAFACLKKYSWIDVDRIGIQGHSWGGYETLVLIANTEIFKAAQESAGPANLISSYSEIMGNISRQYLIDIGQTNIGSSPWDNTQKFIRNSPLFQVKNIHTPLLIMHNEEDSHVSFSHARDMFTALRRLKKPTWLLKYKDETHGILNTQNQLDFDTKQQQFFGYYLKGEPIPDWMQ